MERQEAAPIGERIRVPEGTTFADLRLAVEPTGTVSFDRRVVERIAQASGLGPTWFLDGPDEVLALLIFGWYRAHLRAGGDPDPVVEGLFAETLAEERVGQVWSYAPGRC